MPVEWSQGWGLGANEGLVVAWVAAACLVVVALGWVVVAGDLVEAWGWVAVAATLVAARGCNSTTKRCW